MRCQALIVHVKTLNLCAGVLRSTDLKRDQGFEVSVNTGDSNGTKGHSQIGPCNGGGCSNLIADVLGDPQSDVALSNIIAIIPSILGGASSRRMRKRPIDYAP